MKNQNKRNVAESIRARLLKISKNRGEDFDYTLLKYATERFLYRLSKSEYKDQLILKGALLLTVVLKDSPYRVTRDIDFLGRALNSPNVILKILEAICQIKDDTDGVTFDHKSIKLKEIQEANQYHGLRAKFLAFIGSARINMKIDIGFGDIIHPAPAIFL
jgi:predicted nucleotidyltransferase component of viral defense system